MSPKVVQIEDMFFKDDIKIIDAELSAALDLPKPYPILSMDELQIFYKGHIYLASEDKSGSDVFKVYTLPFGLREIDAPKKQEEDYFAANKAKLDDIKRDFVERSVNGIPILNGSSSFGILSKQVISELVERIKKEYESISEKRPASPAGTTKRPSDGSVFAEMSCSERSLVLDDKVYSLSTIPEYLNIFKDSFEPKYFHELEKLAATLTPEEIYNKITDNAGLVHRKALPLARNKIWHSDRSGMLFLDGIYWIPQFAGKLDDITQKYQKFLEKRVKIEAAEQYGGVK